LISFDTKTTFNTNGCNYKKDANNVNVIPIVGGGEYSKKKSIKLSQKTSKMFFLEPFVKFDDGIS
jgi:hypothetical protein